MTAKLTQKQQEAIEHMNAKNEKLRRETLSRRHRETECGPVKVGDVVLAKNIGTYFGYIDCVLICKTVMNGTARFSGYTDDGNLIGEYRWDEHDITRYLATGTLEVLNEPTPN